MSEPSTLTLRVAGLTIRLGPPGALAPPDEVADEALGDVLVVEVAPPRPMPPSDPEHGLLARLVLDDDDWYYGAYRTDTGYLLRVYGSVDFHLDAGLRRACAVPVPGITVEWLALFAQGTLAAFVHTLEGRFVLHASSVVHHGAVLAVLAPSGTGKTTLATALCARGARLLGDDLLRVDLDRLTGAGDGGIRLRSGSWDLLDAFPERPATALTADGRLRLDVPRAGDDEAPLAALVVLQRTTGRGVHLAPLDRRLAIRELFANCRVEGWADRQLAGRLLDDAVRLSARVPAYALSVPTGVASVLDAADVLLAELGRVAADPAARLDRR